jgi:hypothetical protein
VVGTKGGDDGQPRQANPRPFRTQSRSLKASVGHAIAG